MNKTVLPLFFVLLLFKVIPVVSQQQIESDTFFLVKKKGLLGKLGKSISTTAADDSLPVMKPNPYFVHIGKVIRQVKIVRLGFERDINDTSRYNNNFVAIAANAFHRKTWAVVIANNLFFDAGDRLNPYLMADNEKFLRDQNYLQDALIVIDTIPGNKYMVDVLVMVKDVFSLGGSADIASTKRMRIDLKDENIKGSGSRLLISTLYDADRKPKMGLGASFLMRNIKGTFINTTVGFGSFNNAITSGKSEESSVYISFEKPFISPYIPWVGGMDLSINTTKNNYLDTDSFYQRQVQYSYRKVDGWLGYSFGNTSAKWSKQNGRTRGLLSIRGLHQHYTKLPGRTKDTFDFRLSDISAVLGSISVFRQNFTRTNFIYGFGRNEDVPEGFDLSLIAGWVNRSEGIGNRHASRPYYAIDGQRTHLNAKGFFSSYILRLGGYRRNGAWEDVDILGGLEHFTTRIRLAPQWYYRQFYSLYVTRQLNASVLQPHLYLNSAFGLPYFRDGNIKANFRATAKTEAVFYNLHKFWGFRLAPFIFTDVSLIKAVGDRFAQSDLYSAIGAGIRTRNESLVFGTLELKGFYFPRTVTGMSHFMVEVGSNIRFRYNSILVKKPGFILSN